MNENERNERIVCEFLRKIAPPREWEYLGEVEHYWISQLCDELNKQLKAENSKLRELVNQMYRDMQGVLDMSGDTVWVDAIGTLRDKMDHRMQDMSALGIPPMDYEHRMRELGVEGT